MPPVIAMHSHAAQHVSLSMCEVPVTNCAAQDFLMWLARGHGSCGGTVDALHLAADTSDGVRYREDDDEQHQTHAGHHEAPIV
jgi:hypothetical protein